ncbi:MAG: hypothetical protein JXB38_12865 [Anaerolineales bacterium]|nr:hypothetical protein [Anaerolineales bacterium]
MTVRGKLAIISRGIALAVFVAVLVLAANFLNQKFHALAYQEVDFGFYMQFAAKLADPQLSDRYSLTGDGYNLLGLTGTEGQFGFHQAIHFEPAKYLYALVYAIFKHPLALLIFYAFLYLSPLLYLAFIQPVRDWRDLLFLILVMLLFVGFPATFPAIGFDLRPRMLLNAAIPLAVFAVHYRRPLWEKALAFVFLLLIREEALLFGLLIGIYAFYRTEDAFERKRTLWLFGGIWLVGLVANTVYFQWAGYAFDREYNVFAILFDHPLLAAVGAIVGLAGLAGLRWLQVKYRDRHDVQIAVPLAAYTLIFIPIGLQLYVSTLWRFGQENLAAQLPELLHDLIFNPNYTICFVLVWVLLVLIWTYLSKRVVQIGFNLVLLIGVAYCGVQTYRQLPLVSPEEIAKAEPVFAFRDGLDRYEDAVLLDYETYQAYYDFEHAFVFHRLPWYLAPGEARLYNANFDLLVALAENEVDYIIVGRKMQASIQDLLDHSDLVYEMLVEDGAVLIYALHR